MDAMGSYEFHKKNGFNPDPLGAMSEKIDENPQGNAVLNKNEEEKPQGDVQEGNRDSVLAPQTMKSAYFMNTSMSSDNGSGNGADEYSDLDSEDENILAKANMNDGFYVKMNRHNKIYDSDGYYMKKLKDLLNGTNEKDDLESKVTSHYEPGEIDKLTNIGLVKSILDTNDKIIATCKKYLFWNWLSTGHNAEEIKESVRSVRDEARHRKERCLLRIDELKKEELTPIGKENSFGKATSGWRNARNYAYVGFVGMTFGNIWRTLVMVPAAAVWPFASVAKSLKSTGKGTTDKGTTGKGTTGKDEETKKWKSAFRIPHPHWFGYYYEEAAVWGARKLEEKKLEEERLKGQRLGLDNVSDDIAEMYKTLVEKKTKRYWTDKVWLS